MKNKIFTLVLSILVAQLTLAQNQNKVAVALKAFNHDTAQYLKQRIVANKNAYIGKPLDSLLVDLPPATRYSNDDIHSKKNISPKIVLYFESSVNVQNKLDRRELPALLVITWATSLDKNDAVRVGLKSYGGDWTTAAHDYYKNKIVANVQVVRN
jgi:hypothetical protein